MARRARGELRIHLERLRRGDVDYLERVVRERRPPSSAGGIAAPFPLARVVDDDPDAFLVVGQPGSGKTAMLLHVAAAAAERAVHDSGAPIPVFVRLANVRSDEDAFSQLMKLCADDWRTGPDVVEKAWKDGNRREC